MARTWSQGHGRPPPEALSQLNPVALWRAWRDWQGSDLAGILFGIGLLVAGAWAVSEYSHQKQRLRQAELSRHIAEFGNSPVIDAWQRLSRVWQTELARQKELLERVGRQSERRGGTLQAYQRFVLETVDEYELEPDIDIVLRFFHRLALCIRVGSCERGAAADYFGGMVWHFRNQHYYYFAFERPGTAIDRYAELIAPRPIPIDAALVP